ncbi:MAG TPA: cupin domain-containing protein [Vicinamibacterales bacterium]|nr:cupin domain-containing protein [Vicinamibacterales bacterium]
MTRATRGLALAVCAVMLAPAFGSAQQVVGNGVEVTAPDKIKWVRNAAGTQETAVLFGDPTKAGPYVMRLRWLPGNMSRPHFHPNDRFFLVVEGTWWVGAGDKYDPESTVPAPAGSYVLHKAGAIHYDGAKKEPTVIQVWGMGPNTSTPAEKK